MQIGSGNNQLPGNPPPTNAALPATPPAAPTAGGAAGGATGDRKVSCLVVAVLLLVVGAVAAFFMLGRDLKGLGAGSGEPGEQKKLLARLVASLPGAKAPGDIMLTNGVRISAAQQRLVSEYSPAKPINEARRVREVERGRALGQEADPATGAPPVAVTAPVPAAGSPTAPAGSPPVASTMPSMGSRTATPPRVAPAGAGVEKPFVWPDVKITAIIGGAQQGKWLARINGKLVSVGETIDGVNVVAISAQSVTLAANGQQRELPVGSGR
jgi:hypothetical protein